LLGQVALVRDLRVPVEQVVRAALRGVEADRALVSPGFVYESRDGIR